MVEGRHPELRARFEADVLGIDGMSLVPPDKDEEALAIWSRAILASESGNCACQFSVVAF